MTNSALNTRKWFKCRKTNQPTNQPTKSLHEQDTIQNLTGLNSEFLFSWTDCLTKGKEPSLPLYLAIAAGGIVGLLFKLGISPKGNVVARLLSELNSLTTTPPEFPRQSFFFKCVYLSDSCTDTLLQR